jgi:hypothetical protein
MTETGISSACESSVRSPTTVVHSSRSSHMFTTRTLTRTMVDDTACRRSSSTRRRTSRTTPSTSLRGLSSHSRARTTANRPGGTSMSICAPARNLI